MPLIHSSDLFILLFNQSIELLFFKPLYFFVIFFNPVLLIVLFFNVSILELFINSDLLCFWRNLLCLFGLLSVLVHQLLFIHLSTQVVHCPSCCLSFMVPILSVIVPWARTHSNLTLGAYHLGWWCVSRGKAERPGPGLFSVKFWEVSMCVKVYTSGWVLWPCSLEPAAADFPGLEESGYTLPQTLLFPRAVFTGWNPQVRRLWGREQCPEPGICVHLLFFAPEPNRAFLLLFCPEHWLVGISTL